MRQFLYVPFTGLGLYGGFRGDRWLKNRLKIFKQFVVPSLQAQTSQDFILWVSWRPEEKNNKRVLDLYGDLCYYFGADKVVFTYHGVCFWDDKHTEEKAKQKLIISLHHTLGELVDYVGDVEDVLMTIQPSDDCYHTKMVEETQFNFKQHKESTGHYYTRGYIMNYQTGEAREYNPETKPPFYTIKFPKQVFIDPLLHSKHTGPYKSHEYSMDALTSPIENTKRGFLVGTHGENISTTFVHPYAGEKVTDIRWDFGLQEVEPLKIKYSLRKKIMRRLPHRVQRKLRYIFGEKIYTKIYNFLRS